MINVAPYSLRLLSKLSKHLESGRCPSAHNINYWTASFHPVTLVLALIQQRYWIYQLAIWRQPLRFVSFAPPTLRQYHPRSLDLSKHECLSGRKAFLLLLTVPLPHCLNARLHEPGFGALNPRLVKNGTRAFSNRDTCKIIIINKTGLHSPSERPELHIPSLSHQKHHS